MAQLEEPALERILPDRLIAASSDAFTQLETDRGRSLTFGIHAIVVISTLARMSFRNARDARSGAVSTLEGPALDEARRVAGKTAEDRMAVREAFASMVWRLFYEAFTALQAAERGDARYREGATSVFAGIDRFIDCYASASNADLKQAGVLTAARMLDPDRSRSKRGRDRKPVRREDDDALLILPKPNPLTLGFPFLLAANGWWIHGWVGGPVAAGSYLALFLVINSATMRWWPPDDLHQLVRRFQGLKWTLFIAILMATSLAGISMGKAL